MRLKENASSSIANLPHDPVGEALSPLVWSYEDALKEIEDKMRWMASKMEALFFGEINRRYGLDLCHQASDEGYGILKAYFPNDTWNGTCPDFDPIIQLLAYITGGRSWQEMAEKYIGRMLAMRVDQRDVSFKDGRLVLYGVIRYNQYGAGTAWGTDTRTSLKWLLSLIAAAMGQEPDFRNLISEEEFDRIAGVGFSVPEQVLQLNGLEGFGVYTDIVERVVFVVKDERLIQRLAGFPERPDGSISKFIRQFFSQVSR